MPHWNQLGPRTRFAIFVTPPLVAIVILSGVLFGPEPAALVAAFLATFILWLSVTLPRSDPSKKERACAAKLAAELPLDDILLKEAAMHTLDWSHEEAASITSAAEHLQRRSDKLLADYGRQAEQGQEADFLSFIVNARSLLRDIDDFCQVLKQTTQTQLQSRCHAAMHRIENEVATGNLGNTEATQLKKTISWLEKLSAAHTLDNPLSLHQKISSIEEGIETLDKLERFKQHPA